MQDLTLHIDGVSKAFHGQQVLNDVSLRMKGGHIYGLVGRNGSGKTVLLKMICGYIAPDKGSITVADKQILCGRSLPVPFGVVFDSAGFIPGISGQKNLRLLAGLRNTITKEKVSLAIQAVGLNPKDPKKVHAYSLGMRQRLAFAQALMEDPDILLFDEPMNGLDASAVELIRTLIKQEKENGKLIIVATHVQEDIRVLCDQVFYVGNGSVATSFDMLGA